MKAIVTKQNLDGTYNEVGMNTRCVLGPYVNKSFIRKKARNYAGKHPHRIEYFADTIQADPVSVEYVA